MENNTVHDAWLDLFKVRRDDVEKLLKDARPRSVEPRPGPGSTKPKIENKLNVNTRDWDRAIDMVMDGLKLIEAEVLLAKQKKLKERK